jgi:membrane protein YqaA with SNARE-associated domain
MYHYFPESQALSFVCPDLLRREQRAPPYQLTDSRCSEFGLLGFFDHFLSWLHLIPDLIGSSCGSLERQLFASTTAFVGRPRFWAQNLRYRQMLRSAIPSLQSEHRRLVHRVPEYL